MTQGTWPCALCHKEKSKVTLPLLSSGTSICHFNRKGFSGTSLDDIAESLDVSKGAFYYHFSGKEALLAQCYEFTLDQFDSIVASQSDKETSPLEKLGDICTAIFGLQNSESGPLIRYNSITALPPDIRRSVLKRTEDTHAKLDQQRWAECALCR